MLPVFPKFKNLALRDRSTVDTLSQKFQHYSDFQFSSLWGWNLDSSVQISVMHDNLVLKMRDYLTGDPIYSFCGTNNAPDTAMRLIELAHDQGLAPVLKFIPQEIAEILKHDDRFIVREDRDNFDYVLSIEESLEINRKKSKRKYLRLFQNRYNPSIESLDMKVKKNRQLIVESARLWTEGKDGNKDQLDNEIPALERLISDLPSILDVVTIFHDQHLIGFSVEEVMDEKFATGHFQRVDYSYSRASIFLNQVVNEKLYRQGVLSINVQQDAGDQELRRKKEEKYAHATFLKKYTVRLKD